MAALSTQYIPKNLTRSENQLHEVATMYVEASKACGQSAFCYEYEAINADNPSDDEPPPCRAANAVIINLSSETAPEQLASVNHILYSITCMYPLDFTGRTFLYSAIWLVYN